MKTPLVRNQEDAEDLARKKDLIYEYGDPFEVVRNDRAPDTVKCYLLRSHLGNNQFLLTEEGMLYERKGAFSLSHMRLIHDFSEKSIEETVESDTELSQNQTANAIPQIVPGISSHRGELSYNTVLSGTGSKKVVFEQNNSGRTLAELLQDEYSITNSVTKKEKDGSIRTFKVTKDIMAVPLSALKKHGNLDKVLGIINSYLSIMDGEYSLGTGKVKAGEFREVHGIVLYKSGERIGGVPMGRKNVETRDKWKARSNPRPKAPSYKLKNVWAMLGQYVDLKAKLLTVSGQENS